jgi:hypothetical protein
MAAVSVVNLVIQKGTYFEETFSLSSDDSSGLNLTNQIATAKLKKHPTAGIAYTFSTTITIGDSTVKISMPNAVTATLPSGRCVYDIILTSSSTGIASKVVQGDVLVQETVSI